jgi:PAS domain S-box-containing protein
MYPAILPTQLGTVKKHLLGAIVVVTFIMILAAALFYWISNAYVLKQAEANITNILLSHKGMHHYVQNTLIPAYSKYQDEGKIPSTFYAPELLSSSYILRLQHTFYNEERKAAGLPELYYKLAATNPRNPVNKADALEEKLIKMFNENRDIKSYRDVIEIDGRKNLYVAIPFLENKERCMRCHSKREDAPAELQQRYPGQGGFNESLGEIRAITSIRSPMQHEYTHIYVIVSTMLVGFTTLVGLFLFTTRLRTLVQKRTSSLEEEIKERTHAEERLRLTRISVEAASDALFWMTPDARIVDVNEAACRSLDYTREELLRLKVSNIDPLYDEEAWQRHFSELRKNSTLMFETAHRAQGGRVFPVEVVANYVQVGTEEYNCAFVRDISERKQAEEERTELETRLRQSQKMEAIGTLAGGIAHDFNNILSAIFGYTELATMETDPEKRDQDLQEVLLGAERAKELVKQILAFSRRTNEAKQPLQVSVIIKEAIKMLRSSIPTTIEIRQDITADGTVLADPTQIHQIIMNLCTNAYHAMRETGGILAVSLSEIAIQEENEDYGELVPGRYLKLEVSDTGCGIPPEIREKIFEPYFTTKKTGEGTGLGLAVVHGIVKSHHGHITVYSEPGKGTTFHVYLPLVAEKAAELPDQEAIADLNGKGERILFIDDEEQLRDFAARLFSMHGYQVTPCINGVQALEEFQSHPDQFDLVITDMTMPYLTGAELAQKILGIRPDMPIILCTGQSELINREKALAMGICDYLNKPIIKHDFLSAIRKALKKKSQGT